MIPRFFTHPKNTRGYTMLEEIIVVAIMGMVGVMAAPYLFSAVGSNDLATTAQGAVDALREAQSSAMSRKNTGKFGVHFEAAKFVFFEGAAYSAGDANNVVHALSGQVAVSAVALSPGGSCTVATGSGNCDVHFANHRGAPTESGSITILNIDGPAKTVTVNAAGMIEGN